MSLEFIDRVALLTDCFLGRQAISELSGLGRLKGRRHLGVNLLQTAMPVASWRLLILESQDAHQPLLNGISSRDSLVYSTGFRVRSHNWCSCSRSVTRSVAVLVATLLRKSNSRKSVKLTITTCRTWARPSPDLSWKRTAGSTWMTVLIGNWLGNGIHMRRLALVSLLGLTLIPIVQSVVSSPARRQRTFSTPNTSHSYTLGTAVPSAGNNSLR